MNKRKVKEIIKFDIEKNIQNKWFVILNIVLFISVLLMTNWGNITKFLDDHGIDLLSMKEVTIQVLDEENLIYNSLTEKYKDYEKIKFEKVDKNEYSKDNVPKDEVVLLEIKRDEKSIISSKIVSKEGIDDQIYTIIYDEIKEVRSRVFAEKNNINLDELNILNEEPNIERELLGVDAENSETKQAVKMVSIVLVYMILIFILSNIANTIAQEKVSKSIEYVLTSVTAKEYLIAKVLGVTLTILIQVLYTFIYYMMGNMISSLFVAKTTGEVVLNTFANVDTSIISYCLVMAGYLIFTVFLTALIQAALSSKTTSIAEAGNTTMLLMSVVIILYFASIALITPYNKVTFIMYIISCLPLVSTFFVPAMMIIGQATLLQVIISFIVLIVTVPLIFNLCAKHFKNGILDYTTSKKKKGLLKNRKEKKELTLKEKQEYDLHLVKTRKYAFAIGMGLIIFVFLETVCSFILGIALPSVLSKLNVNTIMILSTAIISIIAMGITAVFINMYSDYKKEESKLTGKKIFEYTFIGITLIGILQVVLSYIYSKLGMDYNVLESFEVLPGAGILDKVIYFVGIAIVPAIFEELLFRKAILNYSKRFGKLFAVLFSALIFGLIHMNLSQGIFAFILGIIFAIIAIKTNSIKITMLLHFLNNGYAALKVIFDGSKLVTGILDNIVLAFVVVGVIILLKNLPKLKNLNKEDFKINKDCKLLIKNYTFIISIILVVVMFAVTETSLRI